MNKALKKVNVSSVILAIAMVLLPIILKYLLPRKIFISCILLILASITIAAVLVPVLCKEKTCAKTWIFLFIASLYPIIQSFRSSNDYSFASQTPLPFWEIPLIISIILAITVTVKWLRERTNIPARIGYFVLIVFVSFFVLWSPIIHLNFVLDFSEPEQCYAIIEEKDIDRLRKSPDIYKFKVSIDGESYSLTVSMLEYEQYKVGDIYVFERYNGAFNMPFYISDPASN